MKIKHNHLYRHKETGEYYILDLSQSSVTIKGKSFSDRLNNNITIMFWFYPVKKTLFWLSKSGTGKYDKLENYVEVKYYGD